VGRTPRAPRAARRVGAALALALLAGLPAQAHLRQRGTPLSELSASSPVAVVGRVASAAGPAVELVVEEAVPGADSDWVVPSYE